MRTIDADALILHFNDVALAMSPNDTDGDNEKYRKRIVYETLQEYMSQIDIYAHSNQVTEALNVVYCHAWPDKMKVVLDKGAFMPERAHPTDAGLDIFSPIDMIVRAHGSAIIPTGVHVQLPPDTAGQIWSKSGLNIHQDILTTGLIDEGYTGMIIVKLFNFGMDDYMVHRMDKIAQLVVGPVFYVEPERADSPLPETSRGDNGFGSTGR